MSLISAQSVLKKFGSNVVLDGIAFDIKPGEFLFLTGSSGSGKTTLLRLLMGDLPLDAGELKVIGTDVVNLREGELSVFRRQIGVVFQDFKLLPDRSVFENVSLPLEISAMPYDGIKKLVGETLELVGLSNKPFAFPAQLSGGELQRVSLARAVISKPKLILADEPTGNLDPQTAKSIIKLLVDIHKIMQTTVIVATHNADIVDALQMRVLSLKNGKISKDRKGKYE